MKREQKINIISLIILIGFAVSVFFHYVRGVYLGMGYPFNTFLFISEDRFMDFYNNVNVSNNPYINTGNLVIPYFPLLMLIVRTFKIIINKNLSLIIYITISISFFFYIFYSNLKTKKIIEDSKNIFIILFLSYPVLFTIDRANFEAFVFIFIYFFVMFYYKDKILIASIFLILAISMKLFPAVFLLLYINDRKFREILIITISAISCTLVSYSLFPGGFILNLSNHLKNLKLYDIKYAIGDMGLQMGNSLWGVAKIFFKAILHFFHNSWAIDNIIILSKYYAFLAIIIFLLLACYIIFVEKLFWKKIFILTTSICVLPYVSADYKLLHLFIPLFLFINYNSFSNINKLNDPTFKPLAELKKKYDLDLFYIIIFGLLMIPKDYYIFFNDVSISIILNPLLMTLMTIVIIVEGFINKNNLKQQTLPAKNIIL